MSEPRRCATCGRHEANHVKPYVFDPAGCAEFVPEERRVAERRVRKLVKEFCMGWTARSGTDRRASRPSEAVPSPSVEESEQASTGLSSQPVGRMASHSLESSTDGEGASGLVERLAARWAAYLNPIDPMAMSHAKCYDDARFFLRAIADEIEARRTRYDTAKYPIDDLVRDLRTEAGRHE